MLRQIVGHSASVICLFGAFSCVQAARAETLDQLYVKAKLEKALVIYTGSGPAAAKASAAAFEKRFPGISVTAVGGFSNVLDRDIDQQLKDGKVAADFVLFQTIQDFHNWDAAHALMHFKPEGFDQVLDPLKDGDGAWVALHVNPLFYGYNSAKVQESDAPQSALDFLTPKFRGGVVSAYPADDDATLYNFELIGRKYGADYMTRYLANQPYFIEGHRDVAARVGSGADLVSLDLSNDTQTSGSGANGHLKIAMSVKDQTPTFFTAGGILAAAPHPNAAKLYLTWQLSKELQGRSPIAYSPRRDVPPPAGLPPLSDPRFANGYADFVGDGTQLPALRARYEALTGPVVHKPTVP